MNVRPSTPEFALASLVAAFPADTHATPEEKAWAELAQGVLDMYRARQDHFPDDYAENYADVIGKAAADIAAVAA